MLISNSASLAIGNSAGPSPVAPGAQDNSDLVLDASIADGTLHVISFNFHRLDIPLAKIPPLAHRAPNDQLNFEPDRDGAFLYWPALDVHLGWEQLQQIDVPALTLKAKLKTQVSMFGLARVYK